jgi:hypothetical protein
MRLNHLTLIAHVPPMVGYIERETGQPHVGEGIKPSTQHGNVHNALDRPAVWLTALDHLKTTSEDDLWMDQAVTRGFLSAEDAAGLKKHGLLAGRDTMITVDLAPNSKRLQHYETWLRRQDQNHPDVILALDALPPSMTALAG